YNFRCLVCNEPVDFHDFGFGITTARSESQPSEVLRCGVRNECLPMIASPEYDVAAGLLPPGWRCLVCGEEGDLQRGRAMVTEFARDGGQRVGKAPNHTAHAE